MRFCAKNRTNLYYFGTIGEKTEDDPGAFRPSCSGLRGECREKACFPRLKRDLRTEKWTLSDASILFSLDFFACAFGSVLFRIALQRFHEALQLLIGVKVGILSAAVAVFAALDALGTEVLQGQYLFLGVTDLESQVMHAFTVGVQEFLPDTGLVIGLNEFDLDMRTHIEKGHLAVGFGRGLAIDGGAGDGEFTAVAGRGNGHAEELGKGALGGFHIFHDESHLGEGAGVKNAGHTKEPPEIKLGLPAGPFG